MKLIKWVEVHIGRRKSKKERDKEEPSPSVVKKPVRPLCEPPLQHSPLQDPRRAFHIRTSFLEAAPSSPRQRSRIRTNPWHTIGSEDSLVGSQSSQWSESPAPADMDLSLPRRSGLKRSDWIDFQEAAAAWAKETLDESSDEAYSEDYINSEDPSTPSTIGFSKEVGSPQADSACGSCSTTPMSENGPSEKLDTKLQRLKTERILLHLKMEQSRTEDQFRKEEKIRLQHEIVEYRRLMLFQTLQDLRCKFEEREEHNVKSGDHRNQELWLQNVS